MTFTDKILSLDNIFSKNKSRINGPGHFKALINNFQFSMEDIEDHLLYPEDLPYGRKCVFRSENFEVVVMNWKPFNSSNIHDHGNSYGCVYSVSGRAINVLYDENLKQIGSVQLLNNTIAEVPKGIFHAIENNSNYYAVSLHFYAPPMEQMKVIDKNDKSKSYFVKNQSGAWNPDLVKEVGINS